MDQLFKMIIFHSKTIRYQVLLRKTRLKTEGKGDK